MLVVTYENLHGDETDGDLTEPNFGIVWSKQISLW